MKSLDGLSNNRDRIPRRAPQRNSAHATGAGAHPKPVAPVPKQPLHHASAKPVNDRSIDIGTISPDLDIKEPPKKGLKTRRKFFLFGPKVEKKRWSRKKKIIVGIISFLLLAILGVAGYLASTLLASTGKIFENGNVLQAVFSNKELKADQYGRSNILVFGTSEDDPGHPGADLTDSIMIVSVDQKKHDAFLTSVPRDLWVKYGKACPSGYEGKINALYLCGKGNNEDEKAGQEILRGKVSEVFGIDLQYVVHVNYKVLQESVDALGGVDIVIESSDERGILDRNFDWRCNYKCHFVKYPNGPVHLDGEHALYLSQARNDAGGYGLPRGNFDREANQRKILIAAREKASSAGFLANPVKVTKLIESLGDNVRTNFDAAEIKTLADIAKNTPTDKIASVSLIDQQPALLTTGAGPNGASIVRPVAGIYSFGGLQAFMKAYLSGGAALISEAAVIDVLNGTSTPGLAQTKADALANEGLKVGKIANSSDKSFTSSKLYDLSKGTKPATKEKLEKTLGITVTTEPLPTSVKSDAAFVLIVGGN